MKQTAIAAALALAVSAPVAADNNWRAGLFLRSTHLFDSTYFCRGIRKDYNNEQNGIYVGYNRWFIGTAQNSYANCSGVDDYSTFLGWETPDRRLGSVNFSASFAVSPDYPKLNTAEYEETFEFFVSFNVRYEKVKLWYSLNALTIGLEHTFD